MVVDTIIVDNQKNITLKYIPGDAPPPFLLPKISGTGTNLANLSQKAISNFAAPSYALASGTYPVGGPAFFANVYLFYSGNANKP